MEFVTPTTTQLSDTLAAIQALVDIHNNLAETLGEELTEKTLEQIAHGVIAVQEINPEYFTDEEFNWINELATQLVGLSDSQGENE
tara:strand:- start:11484 stop:11741 length:258 start_codon:yes stop_codon:yes gene_type:complete